MTLNYLGSAYVVLKDSAEGNYKTTLLNEIVFQNQLKFVRELIAKEL